MTLSYLTHHSTIVILHSLSFFQDADLFLAHHMTRKVSNHTREDSVSMPLATLMQTSQELYRSPSGPGR